MSGPAGGDVDLAAEIAVLAALLAEVVQLAAGRAVFPSRWALIAEMALEHDSVHAALQAEAAGASASPGTDTPPLGVERIIAGLHQLHELVPGGTGHADD